MNNIPFREPLKNIPAGEALSIKPPGKSLKNSSGNIRNTVLLALFIAVTCIFTMSIRIPTFTGGYINPGDITVIFAGFLFGGTRGFIAGALGSAMADFLGGYFIFVPITFFAKGGEAFIAGYIGKDLNKDGKFIYLMTGGILSVLWMVAIYFLGETLFMGSGKAFTAIIPNLFQAFIGLIGSIMLYNLTGSTLRKKI
jgi:uncharacterized membrane protein